MSMQVVITVLEPSLEYCISNIWRTTWQISKWYNCISFFGGFLSKCYDKGNVHTTFGFAQSTTSSQQSDLNKSNVCEYLWQQTYTLMILSPVTAQQGNTVLNCFLYNKASNTGKSPLVCVIQTVETTAVTNNSFNVHDKWQSVKN